MSNLTKLGCAGFALSITILLAAIISGLIAKYLEDNKYMVFTMYGFAVMNALIFSLILAFAGMFV